MLSSKIVIDVMSLSHIPLDQSWLFSYSTKQFKHYKYLAHNFVDQILENSLIPLANLTDIIPNLLYDCCC